MLAGVRGVTLREDKKSRRTHVDAAFPAIGGKCTTFTSHRHVEWSSDAVSRQELSGEALRTLQNDVFSPDSSTDATLAWKAPSFIDLHQQRSIRRGMGALFQFRWVNR